DRSFRRREGRVSLSRWPLRHRDLRRTDRAPVRRPDAPDEPGQPHPEAGRPPGADHAQHRRAARHLGNPAGVSSRILPRLHTAGGRHGRGGRAAQSQIRPARDPPTAGEFRFRSDGARDRRVSRRAASRVRLDSASAGALPAEHRFARRRHLRRGQEDRRGAGALSRVVVHVSAARRNAAYLAPDVRLDAGTRRLHAAFVVRNDSAGTWRPSEGFGVGYHLFDAETGTLIVDGARVFIESEVKPGETAPVRLEIELPAEDGVYRVLLSPMRENFCWYYEQGWPFLLVETSTENGAARLDRARVATRASLAREGAARAIGRAFVYPVTTVWRNRSLIRVMVRRDILGRYRGSFGGAFWTIIN